MPIVDLQEARDLDEAIEGLVGASSDSEALRWLQRIFVERLDFNPASGSVPLRTEGLPPTATRVAERAGVNVVAVALQRDRILAADVWAALKKVRRTLGDEVLLVATDGARSQWHFAYPSEKSGREVLRRMVVEQGQPRRTVVEQLAGVYRDTFGGRDLRTALDAAYDVEAVTRRFFREYRYILP